MSDFKREYGSPETGHLDELIANASSLIASVYDILEQPRRSPQVESAPLLGRRTHNNSDSSGQLGSSNSSSPNSPKTPRLCLTNRTTTPSSQEIDREIKRIDRFCERMEQDLRSTRIEADQLVEAQLEPMLASSPSRRAVNRSPRSTPPRVSVQVTNPIRTPTPEEVIDLSDSTYMLPAPIRYSNPLNVSDDVIIVTPSGDEIVDLCTPTFHRNTQRSRSNNFNIRPPNFDLNTNDTANNNTIRRRLIASRRHSSTNGARTNSRRTSPSLPVIPTLQIPNDISSSHCSVSSNTSTTNIGRANAKNNNQAKEAHCDNFNASVTTDNGRTPFMCAVCMESTINNQPTSTKCGHVFCAKCIRQALRLTRKCPMCNTKLTPNMLFRIYV